MTMIEAVDVGSEVALKVLGADRMVHAVDASLDVAPHTLDVVGVDPPSDIHLGVMLDGLMGIPKTGESVIAGEVIGIDHLAVRNVFLNHRKQCVGLHVRDYLDDGLPALFYQTSDYGLSCGSPAPFSWPPPADVGLIDFDLSEQNGMALGHQRANLLEHPPSCLVSDSAFPLQLLGRYSRSGRGQEKHGVEPRTERSTGLVEDGVGRRRDLISAEFTAIDLPSCYPVVFGDPLAICASNPIRPTGLFQEVKTGIIVRELGIELLLRVLLHEPIIAGAIRVVKG